ncbi:hypothetical protein PCANC_27313 [Puccinia coronata f. sp. avenae]|uniref:DUF6589 domain-containing protein n=1 Tax=Puccinia coronata f. sp. avenae TaxID=200324 RepID=A0A2N5TPD2_9BASI|nr:hypothetical protein PCANC_27313 [Puccinia coronata f. sp. avenae]
MCHGTWGYIHHPNPKLLSSIDPSKLTLQSYYDALSKVSTMKIDLSMFMPTVEEEKHFEIVLKSQLARAMTQYICKPDDCKMVILQNPPPVEPIDPAPPIIQMLKLMPVSDNSEEGAGQVFEALMRQFGMKPEDFGSRVQIVNAELSTCKNFHSE